MLQYLLGVCGEGRGIVMLGRAHRGDIGNGWVGADMLQRGGGAFFILLD